METRGQANELWKEGRPFVYPDSLIRLLAFIRLLFHLPYRQLEGFTRALYVDGLKVPDYTTLDRRINKLNINDALRRSKDSVYIAVDWDKGPQIRRLD